LPLLKIPKKKGEYKKPLKEPQKKKKKKKKGERLLQTSDRYSLINLS